LASSADESFNDLFELFLFAHLNRRPFYLAKKGISNVLLGKAFSQKLH
jgi:hypothetical protein